MSGETVGIAIIGCGGIGARRASAVDAVETAELVAASEVDEQRGHEFSQRFSVDVSRSWKSVVARKDVDVVIVATSNDMHAEVSIEALRQGKHVLCEKPLARNPVECETMVRAAEENGVRLKTGFNHRYSHQTWKARELFDAGEIGDLIFIRGRTGHGNGHLLAQRWFGNFDLSGGGTFLDNGVHLLDLSRWFMGDFVEATGYVSTHLPQLGRCEDNGFGVYRTEDGRICQLQSSWTQWQGYLLLELFGTDGALVINYDDASCTLVRRGAETTCFQYRGVPDRSWEREIEELIAAARENRDPLASGYDGWQAVRMAYAVYESSSSGFAVRL